MDERVFGRLARLLEGGPCVLASVIETRGATPRKSGSRMLITAAHSEFSIGGGAAEARVLVAARELLQAGAERHQLDIDLSGRAGAAGICGGLMRLALRRWQGAEDLGRAQTIAAQLAAGQRIQLNEIDLGNPAEEWALPNPRLLIVGAGHCAAALCDLAAHLDYDVWVHDARADMLAAPEFARVSRICGPSIELVRAFASERALLVVLLNRDFGQDVAALRVLAGQPCRYLGMMGSQRRIAEVHAALGAQSERLSVLTAPVGLEIGAHTPHEIAVSILAQLIHTLRH